MDELERRALLAFNTGGVAVALMQSGLDAVPVIDHNGNYETAILLRQEPPFRNVILRVELENNDA